MIHKVNHNIYIFNIFAIGFLKKMLYNVKTNEYTRWFYGTLFGALQIDGETVLNVSSYEASKSI